MLSREVDFNQPTTWVALNKSPEQVVNRNNVDKTVVNKTVVQKTAWHDAFADLWRYAPCAYSAPGQPPSSPSACRVLSCMRQRLFNAAALSNA